MSLKAKLEAVIYAAEEPVSLAQLAALFADEALAWKTSQQPAAQTPEPVEETVAAESLPLELPTAESGESAKEETTGEEAAATAGQEAGEAQPPDTTESGESASAEAAANAEAAAAAELKRQAKLFERESRAVIRKLMDDLIAEYAADERGIEIREIAGGYRMATKPEFHDAVRSFVKSQKPPLKLSLPALETLAVIAYKQPITAPEVNEIRGVDSSGVFGSLLARKLIATAGRKQVVGRPILYKTTREFLMRFGLKDVSELPSMEEFEKMASELDEPETATAEATKPAESEFNAEMSAEAEEDGSPAAAQGEAAAAENESAAGGQAEAANETESPAETAPATSEAGHESAESQNSAE
jgi:segregation and condensation protein B